MRQEQSIAHQTNCNDSSSIEETEERKNGNKKSGHIWHISPFLLPKQ